MARYKSILVAVDGSKQSEKAFQEALEISKANRANLYVACIINEVEVAYSAYAYSKILAEEKANVKKEMLKKVHDAKAFGLKHVIPIVELGNHKEYLTKIIPEAYSIDLIVIGATGKGAIQKFTVGSTTDYVVNHAPCSVVVVK